MRRQILILVFLGVLTAIVSSGCGPGADLVPVNPTSKINFCNREGDHLLIYVKNQGNAEALSSAVEVQFSLGPGYNRKVRSPVATGILGPGETTTSGLYVEIPDECFKADCSFTITVDILNEVKETNEGNNSVEGNCIG